MAVAALITATMWNPLASAQEVPVKVPSTVDQAKQGWIEAAHQQELYGERVKGAEEALEKAQQKVAAAETQLTAAGRAVAATEPRLVAADRVLAGYQSHLDAVVNATFRGARLDEMSALLTAGTPSDLLEQAGSIDRVAADVQASFAQAAAAKRAALQAKATAVAAQHRAAAAKTTAERAATAALAARRAVDSGQVELAARVHTYQVAYASLTAADKSSAAADMEAFYSEQAQRPGSGVQAVTPGEVTDPTSAGFAAEAARLAPTVQAGIAVEAALSRQGLPYIYAADGPDSFDCSGLTRWAYQQAGIDIPRVSYEQATLRDIPLDQLRPGDLVTYYSPVSHVAMYVGHGKVVHASTEGVPIKVVDLTAAGPDPSGHRVVAG